MKMRRSGFILIFILILVFSGCSKSKDIESDAIITIEDEGIGTGKVMIYLLQVKEEFEKVGGNDVWHTEDFTGGKSAEQVAKEGTLENIIRNTILESKAKGLNIELTKETIEETTELAENYYLNIPKDVVETSNITEEIVIDTFLELRLASEVSNSINENYQPTEEQILDKMLENHDYVDLLNYEAEDVITTTVVEHILTKTSRMDVNGEIIPLTEEEQDKAYGDIKKAYTLAKQRHDFNDLMEEYSQEDEEVLKGQYEISVSLVEDEIKTVLKDLKVGEISEIAQTENGYYLFKILEIVEPTQEEIEAYEKEFIDWENYLREEAIKNLKKQVFDSIYMDWRNEVSITINNALYEEMSLFE